MNTLIQCAFDDLADDHVLLYNVQDRKYLVTDGDKCVWFWGVFDVGYRSDAGISSPYFNNIIADISKHLFAHAANRDRAAGWDDWNYNCSACYDNGCPICS